MVRRWMNGVLLLAGAGTLTWAVGAVQFDLRRGVAIGLLTALGAVLNLLGLLRTRVSLRGWLRALAVLVGLAILLSVLAARSAAVDALKSLSPSNLPLRDTLAHVVQGYSWLAFALLYVLLSVLALPPASAPRPLSLGEPAAGPPANA